jgi:Domain of unknown function (DUF5916)/Carbohydrate family 9 binding domain-like
MIQKIVTFLVFIFVSSSVFSQTQEMGGAAYQQKYQLHIKKTSEPIKIDGLLADEGWSGAAIADNFAAHWPQDNVPLKRRTEVKMALDERYLYVAATCYDTSYHIIQTLKRDASFFDSDGFSVVLDPQNSKTNGFIFGVTPANAQSDDLLSSQNFGDLSGSWDNKWISATKVYKDHWTVELAIPFKTLRFDPAKKIWGLNFIRNDLKNNQYSTWTFIPVNFNGYDLGYTGSLHFDDVLPMVKGNVSLIPYSTGGLVKDNENNTNLKTTFGAGLDAKIAITPSMNLDLTANPDFSQIEVDKQVTNLTRFNIFFPERRTFFLENDDLFSSYGSPPFKPFFSRSIGLDQNARPIKIIGGARLSGNLDKNWRVGLLTMQTAAKDSSYPSQNFTAFSVNRKISKRSIIKGYMLNRQGFLSDKERKNNPLSEYGRNAGMEFNYSNVAGNINAWAGYHVSQKPTITNQNNIVQFGGGYYGRNLDFTLDLFQIGTNYYADMGFLNRVENYTYSLDSRGRIAQDTLIRLGYRAVYNEVNYYIRPKASKINSHQFGVETFLVWNPNGSFAERFNRVRYFIDFKNTSSLRFRFDDNDVQALFPFGFTDSQYPLPSGEYKFTQYNVQYNSDYRKKFYYSVSARAGGFYNGTLNQLQADVTFRAQPWGNFAISFEQNDIKLPEPYGNDLLLLISPRIEINFSTQLFWTTFLQFNTQRNNFNINSRLQWRYKPLSDFFLVYTDNYFTDPLFKNKNRALVFKLNYWLTL